MVHVTYHMQIQPWDASNVLLDLKSHSAVNVRMVFRKTPSGKCCPEGQIEIGGTCTREFKRWGGK